MQEDSEVSNSQASLKLKILLKVIAFQYTKTIIVYSHL